MIEKPIVMSDEEWENIMKAHKEIVKVLDKHNVPNGLACKILIDIERSIDGGFMRTVMEAKK